MRSHCSRSRAFTVVELLVSIAVIAALIGLLVPALAGMRRGGITAACLSNMRNLGQAHWLYLQDHKGRFIDVGLSHGGLENEDVAWINTLQPYYDNKLTLKSPADRSPHWSVDEGGQGVPTAGTTDRFRRTSYGCNNYLSRNYSPAAAIDPAKAADRLSKVPDPANTAHFLIMAFEGDFAGTDHVHVEEWFTPGSPGKVRAEVAASQCQIDAHGGPAKSLASKSNYGFVDGHVETCLFSQVCLDRTNMNRVDPDLAKFWAVRHARNQ